MELGLSGRVAIVTASSAGLGFAVAAALAAEGCDLVVCGRDPNRLAGAAQRLREHGGQVVAAEVDVAEPGAAEALVARSLEELGRLDVVVGNVGGPPARPALEVGPEDVAATLQRSVQSQAALVLAAAPVLVDAGWGRICLLAATGVKEPLPNHSLSALRAGLWGWAKSLSHTLGPHGVTLNMVCPGMHATERLLEAGHDIGTLTADTPHLTGLVGDPDDLGRLVAVLCSDVARWVNGVALNVDGGATLALL